MHVLTQEEMAFWHENGYVIVRDALPQANLDAVVDIIWEFMEMDRDDPETWYRLGDGDEAKPKLKESGMAELYQHQALWENRQHPRVYGAFADIWGTEKLWVSFDRVNLNPPARADWDFQGFVHWDIDTSLVPLPNRVQGVLSLVDVPAEAGGLQVVPGFHRRFDEWVKTQPADRNPRIPDMAGLELKSLATNAGDLVIWNSLLPHGTGRNNSTRPRLAQYITMFPAKEDDEAMRQERIKLWRERKSPDRKAFPGDPRRWEIEHGATAKLTPLGEKLLGLRNW
ncbi:MAG: phytanoyl-CoA dioxygenase family protein [Chloroflexi bacterium]|nr:phytanoyl-CoA dioxygenase family protein [Chloroflexota bacterium]